MSKHNPDPRQKPLVADPRQQRELIRRVSLGGPTRKAMLFALDSHIGGQNAGWSLTYAELGKEIDVSEKTAYNVAKELDTLGVIRRESQGNRRVRFSICWGVLRALDEEQAEAASIDQDSASPTEASFPPGGNPVPPSGNDFPCSGNPVPAHGNHIRKSALIQHTESPLLAQPAAERPNVPEWVLKKEDLKSPEIVFRFAERFEIPLGHDQWDNRRRVLMAAILALRGKNPGGLFVSLLKKGAHGDWSTLSDDDHEAAKQLLREHGQHCEPSIPRPESPFGMRNWKSMIGMGSGS